MSVGFGIVRTKNVLPFQFGRGIFCIDVQENPMVSDMFRIPKLAETADGKVVVTHWGQAASLLFRVGDEVIVNPNDHQGLLLMSPKGWGNPMFGRRCQGQLVSEPAGAPANGCRWSVRGSVQAVERDLERGGIGPGRWWCSVRVDTSDLILKAEALEQFEQGWMSASEVDALCRRAAVAPEVYGVYVAVACGDSKMDSEALLELTGTGRLRFSCRPDASISSDTGLVLPGPWRRVRDTARPWTDFEISGARVVAPRKVAVGGGSRVQLSLFGDTAILDG